MTSSLRDLKVYTTYPHSCSYLQDREAVTLFVDPRQVVDKTLYSKLSAAARLDDHSAVDVDNTRSGEVTTGPPGQQSFDIDRARPGDGPRPDGQVLDNHGIAAVEIGLARHNARRAETHVIE